MSMVHDEADPGSLGPDLASPMLGLRRSGRAQGTRGRVGRAGGGAAASIGTLLFIVKAVEQDRG